MRILIASMPVPLPARGPYSRISAVAAEAVKRNHTVAVCAAKDAVFKDLAGTTSIYSSAPSLGGIIPFPLIKIFMPVVESLNIQGKRKLTSYEKVVFDLGISRKAFFKKDVRCIQEAIRLFKPDVVYSEVRIAAIVAAKIEGVPCAAGVSYPVLPEYASNPELSSGVKHFLLENGLPHITSVLDIFHWADRKIVGSSYELEPVEGDDVYFAGPILNFKTPKKAEKTKNIIIYLGVSPISHRKIMDTVKEAFHGTEHQVFTVIPNVTKDFDNIHIRPHFDFSRIMPGAEAYIHHGGQNSTMTGLIYGVPQIVFAGEHFERCYNAGKIMETGAGLSAPNEAFTPEKLNEMLRQINWNPTYRQISENTGKKLLELGGPAKVVDVLESAEGIGNA